MNPSKAFRENLSEAIDLYKGGRTLEQIGIRFGVSRQRVKQIFDKCGISSENCGVTARRDNRIARMRSEIDARCISRKGCTLEQYSYLRSVEGNPVRRFRAQKGNAYMRKIPWQFKLWEWWTVWEQSGKWSLRGRHLGEYVMARINDAGPYSPSNVKITTCTENILEHYELTRAGIKPPRKPAIAIDEKRL